MRGTLHGNASGNEVARNPAAAAPAQLAASPVRGISPAIIVTPAVAIRVRILTALVRRVATVAAVAVRIQILTALARRVVAIATVAATAVSPAHFLLLASLSAPAVTPVILDAASAATTTRLTNRPGGMMTPTIYGEVNTACWRDPPVSPQPPACSPPPPPRSLLRSPPLTPHDLRSSLRAVSSTVSSLTRQRSWFKEYVSGSRIPSGVRSLVGLLPE